MLENMRISIQGIWSHKMRFFSDYAGYHYWYCIDHCDRVYDQGNK